VVTQFRAVIQHYESVSTEKLSRALVALDVAQSLYGSNSCVEGVALNPPLPENELLLRRKQSADPAGVGTGDVVRKLR